MWIFVHCLYLWHLKISLLCFIWSTFWELWFDRSTPFCHSCFTSWLCLTCVFVPDWSYKTYFCSLLFCDVLLWWKYLYLYILIHVLSFLCNLLTNLFNMNALWVNFLFWYQLIWFIKGKKSAFVIGVVV